MLLCRTKNVIPSASAIAVAFFVPAAVAFVVAFAVALAVAFAVAFVVVVVVVVVVVAVGSALPVSVPAHGLEAAVVVSLHAGQSPLCVEALHVGAHALVQLRGELGVVVLSLVVDKLCARGSVNATIRCLKYQAIKAVLRDHK